MICTTAKKACKQISTNNPNIIKGFETDAVFERVLYVRNI